MMNSSLQKEYFSFLEKYKEIITQEKFDRVHEKVKKAVIAEPNEINKDIEIEIWIHVAGHLLWYILTLDNIELKDFVETHQATNEEIVEFALQLLSGFLAYQNVKMFTEMKDSSYSL